MNPKHKSNEAALFVCTNCARERDPDKIPRNQNSTAYENVINAHEAMQKLMHPTHQSSEAALFFCTKCARERDLGEIPRNQNVTAYENITNIHETK
jgi:predicted metal-binding protein